MRSKRFEALAKRPVNQDGFVKEWIEEGFIAMESPNDPKPSIKIVNGAVTELDGKPVSDFDLIDHFIARYGINLNRAEEVMAMDSVKLANMLCDPNVKSCEIVPLTTAMTPAQIVEVVSYVLMTLGAVTTLTLGVEYVMQKEMTAGALIAQTVLAILEERDPDERSTAP